MEVPAIIEQLTETVKTMSGLLEKMSDNHDKLFTTHGSQKEQINSVREVLKEATGKITKIITVLYEGNGQLPLVTRVAVLEEKVTDNTADVARLYDKVEGINLRDNVRADEQASNAVATKKVNKELIAAIVSAAAAIAAAVSAAM